MAVILKDLKMFGLTTLAKMIVFQFVSPMCSRICVQKDQVLLDLQGQIGRILLLCWPQALGTVIPLCSSASRSYRPQNSGVLLHFLSPWIPWAICLWYCQTQ